MMEFCESNLTFQMRLILISLLLIVSGNGGSINDKLEDIQDELFNSMQLSPETKRSLEERIKRAPKNNRTRVNPKGDYIFEINERNNLSKKFYQGDIALSLAQEEDILQDIEQQLGRAGRSKRQAFGRRFHKKLWKNATVYYSFDKNISKFDRREGGFCE